MPALERGNVIGAFILALADRIGDAVETAAPERGCAAAALMLIRHQPGFLVERLHGVIGLSQPGTVRLIDRLQQRGLVRRRSGEEDRRTVGLFLTEDGQAVCTDIIESRARAVSAAISGLTAHEVTALADMAGKVLGSLPKDAQQAYRICRLCDEAHCPDCPVDDALAGHDDRSSIIP